MNAILLMFNDDLSKADVDFSVGLREILKLYPDKSFVFEQHKEGTVFTITVEVGKYPVEKIVFNAYDKVARREYRVPEDLHP